MKTEGIVPPVRSAIVALGLLAALLGGCATTTPKQQQVAAPASTAQLAEAQRQANAVVVKTLKRKVAIGRFSNETRYGKSFQVDASNDPLGKQASDMLATRLVASQKFLVFERPDLDKVKAEQSISQESGLVGVDALIMGSVTEFGRSTTGKSGFLSDTKIQTAHAKVEIRLVDVRSGHVFFTATGSGDATTESGDIAGFGSKADYDATLNDRAIAAAISDVQNTLMSKLQERPWRTDVLKIDGHQLYMSGGSRQGLKVGDTLAILHQGEQVKSGQSGFGITLPPATVGKVRVVSFFGDNETNEGSVAEILSGDLSGAQTSALYISESKE
ncbi:MAG: curli production assembly protein CsgG [Proteobacteria bacterium]|nr:curli production assembly protein CsgG [Pseudomonadota bacterium]